MSSLQCDNESQEMTSLYIIYFFAAITLSQGEFLNEPHIQTIDGHFYIYGANDKNISFEISPKGYLNVNGENLYKVVKDAKQAATSILSLKYTALFKLEDDLRLVSTSIEQMSQRLNVCETLINGLQAGSTSGSLPFQLQLKINKLERRVKTILRNLAKRECQKSPCLNGGTCVDKYLDYECRCLEGWEGKSCEKDVNECAKFAGSDLGCQNGATCINKPGTYECICGAGWYGLHCTRRSNDCSSGPPGELCGHGICVTQTNGNKGYTCICEQGWKTDGINPSCTVDVDECVTFPCSRNPLVACQNSPGGFFCGACPPGYSGNGFSCEDINECLVQNGGCSVQPMVQCVNTLGSSTCGPCPPGYLGDGKTCTFLGKCNVDNGGCHPNARCQEVGNNIQCQCQPGYTGSGIGVLGCELLSDQQSKNPCIPNPCKHDGRCYSTPKNNFTCSCRQGYTGRTCNIAKNPCSSNPCQNGGTCISRREYFFCRCTPVFTGRYCQKERQSCGGFLNSDEGILQFPPVNSSSIRYDHNLNCAWIIIVNTTLVINVTFDYFDLESAPECQFDWVQIHDGKSAGDHIIGKFCGNKLPNNGTIISTTNYMYMWFKSDGSKSKIGFKLKWVAVRPVCGGPVNASIHGTIKSPGSPGKYPPNRDCMWEVTAPPGKRITFTFFEVHIESHENCSYDFLEFHEGLTLDSPLLARYCNTTMPPPLVTSGNTALVYFHSDQYQSDRGFQIAFHSTPGYPGCGGIFTTRRGEISPPIEQGRYLKNMDCAWLIRMPDNLRIKTEFSFFKLEDVENCNADFVEIREGSDISAPLIGRYCGFTLPPSITSNDNVLFVRFHSDLSVQSLGFRLVYNSVCRQVFISETGVITSPGYPNKYRRQEVCEFIIRLPPGKVINLEFQDFEFEAIPSCSYDYVEIRDGHDERSPLINKYCGFDRPSKIVSTHNYLFLKLVTDEDVEFKGFYANYTTTDVSCGGIITEKEGEIRFPTEDRYYPPNQNCRWVISGKPGEIIQLTFTSFEVEFHPRCESDFVAVYDNSSSTQGGGLIGKFCGETVPPLLTTIENIMTIVFHSDSGFSSKGFAAIYKAVNTSTICGGNYFTATGVIKSPNYPKAYPNAKTCIWKIQVQYGNKITLNVSRFELEGNVVTSYAQCNFDFLEIRDGGYESSPLIGRYCGRKIPKRIISQSNLLYLKFKSDNTFSSAGFYITWDGTLSGCGGTLTSVSGSIISPNYPEPYGVNSLCIYKIFVSMGSSVLLNIMDLDLDDLGTCLTDYIEIFDGNDDKTSKSLGKFCSNTNHPASVTSTGNQMTIKFVSNIRASGKGFYLKYRTGCKTNITGYRGVIESPNFPDKYPPSSSCTWIIKAPMGNKVNISFSDFNFLSTCSDDYIEIQEGSPSPTNTIGKFCKNKNPTIIASSLNWVHVRFVSSQYSLQGHFRMEWVVNGCGGTFIKPEGSFTSPNYPNLYPPNTVCEYFISVSPSLSINLYVRDINIESSEDCFADVIEIYGGPDARAPLLSKICQKSSAAVQIQTSGNQMYVRFTTDRITGGTGFFANYTTTASKCGGHIISNTGKITSRNYPKNYNMMDNCLWIIQVETNHRVSLTFEDFDLASDSFCNETYVEVFDGPTENSPTILKHCGNTFPSPNSVISTNNYLTVRMRTDQRLPAKGFKASYNMVCGAIIIAYEPGVISPSYYLQSRPISFNCSWTILSPEPDGHITLTVSYMESLDSNQDCALGALYVYEGSDNNSTLIRSFCDRKSHLPIISRGNALFLELNRNARIDTYFWASYSSASSACGGTLNSEVGTFASPNFPGSYPANSECVWNLEAAPGNIYHSNPGNRMQINFKEFDIAESEHCNEEYVEIRQSNASGTLLGVYCGVTAPTNLTSQNKVWIKFRSSKIASGNKGFLADYSIVYGNDINGIFGEIANPLYPRPYMRYAGNINWRVTVGFGSLVRLTFKEIRLDDFYDVICISSVTIYDGYDETASELLKVCGLTKPNPVTSSSNVVYIVFSHFPIHHGSLFLLEWEQVQKPSSWVDVSPTSSPLCSEKIDLSLVKNQSIMLTNPGWPEPFINATANLKCEWIIESPDYQHLVLTINSLTVSQHPKCEYSYLAVHTRYYNTEWKELNRFCLSNETDTHVATTNFMKVLFDAGHYERTLFSVTIERECGNSIQKSNGIIMFHWSNYTSKSWTPTDKYCTWDVTVSPRKKIRVVFTEFEFFATDDTCRDKYVLLRNGGSDDSPLLGKGTYCRFPGMIPLTTSNRLFIKAKIGHRSSSFTMKFEEVSPECGKKVKLDEDFNVTIISSPNYPNIPPSKIECVWIFSTTGSHRLQIDFLERFDLTSSQDCDEEYVEVRDGGTELSEELGKFCSDKPSTQTSTGNMIRVKYYTNATNPKNGFKAQISLARCGGVITSSSGVLTTPGYPNSYLYDTECRWEIETGLRFKLQISFEDIDLPVQGKSFPRLMDLNNIRGKTRRKPFRSFEIGQTELGNQTNCTSSASVYITEPIPMEPVRRLFNFATDFVNRYRNNVKKNIILGYICDNEPIAPIKSSSNKVIIVFRSGPNLRKGGDPTPRGFKLNFTTVDKGCFYRLNTPSGVITSPGYPNESPNYYLCTWRITVPKGRRVTLNVDDFDLPSVAKEHRVLLYNEHQYRSHIATLRSDSKPEPFYQSSANLMQIAFWSNSLAGSGHRGFKFSYNSDEPQVCGGVLKENEGFISSPVNISSFYCKWEFQGRRPDNQTIAIYVKDAVIGNRTGTCFLKYGAVLAITTKGPSTFFQTDLCGNISSQIIRNPFPYTYVTAIQSAWFGIMNFNITYKIFACGGTVYGPETVITSPFYPNNYPAEIDCAWLISFAPGQAIRITFQDFKLQPSCSDFLTVKNGPSPKSPLINQYCGTSLPNPAIITSEGSSLFLEFHSDSASPNKGFKVLAETADLVCGGTVHSLSYELMTPNFPSEYGNNQECEWEIQSATGTHIGLVFFDRFHIETSEDCQKDFVKVFDYVKNEWKLLKTLCGRELPLPINSTSNRMKVLFRSNDAVVSDGFKAKWYQNCGGNLWNTHSGVIVSPGYPKYTGNLDCIYFIESGSEITYLNFSYFNLEQPFKGRCHYDSLAIYESKWDDAFDLVGKFCGTKIPNSRSLRGKIKIEFKTDAFNNYGGFVLSFNGSKCGGFVNESSSISYYTTSDEVDSYLYGNSECVWEIQAPENKIVSLRIEDMNIQYSDHCNYPNLEITEETKNGTKYLARICGHFKPKQVFVKSSSNKITLTLFNTYQKDEGFSAFAVLAYGPASGCGGEISLDSHPQTVQSPDVNEDGFYEEFLDCVWIIRAKPYHQIQANFKSMDVHSCKEKVENNATDNCLCDSVELLDGDYYHSEVLLSACGSEIPSSVTSSGSVISLKFTTDGAYTGKGFTVTFSSKLSQCGEELLTPTDDVQHLTSPFYPDNYPEGLRCKWTIYNANFSSNRVIHIHLVEWDIYDSKGCKSDYLYLEDTGLLHSVYQVDYDFSRNKTPDSVEIIRGQQKSMYFYDRAQPIGKTKFCGVGKAIDFYSTSDEVTVGFFSSSGSSRKGFKLDYVIAGCTRNYSGEFGHIKNLNFKNNSHCYITITAPSPNHTISLYFSSFTMRSFYMDCSTSYIEIRDGPGVKSPKIGKFCGSSNPNPLYSSGQYLWLHFYFVSQRPTDSYYHNVDIIYTTTDKGKGCGGRFSGLLGTFTSPGYPENVRKNSKCRWDFSVPPGMELVFQFSAFDIGPSSTCKSDFIEFYDIMSETNTEVLRSRFCGGDIPAEIRSNADSVAVKYTTSLHNGGTGWRLDFKAVPPGFKII